MIRHRIIKVMARSPTNIIIVLLSGQYCIGTCIVHVVESCILIGL